MHAKRIPGDKPQTVRQGMSTPQHFWRDDAARVNNHGSHSITCAYRVSAKPVPAATTCTHRYSNNKDVRQQQRSRPFAHLPICPFAQHPAPGSGLFHLHRSAYHHMHRCFSGLGNQSSIAGFTVGCQRHGAHFRLPGVAVPSVAVTVGVDGNFP